MSHAAVAAPRAQTSELGDVFDWRQRRSTTSAKRPARRRSRLAALGLAALVAAGFAFAPTVVRFARTAWAPSPLRVEEIGSRLADDGRTLLVEGTLVNRSARDVATPLLRLAVRSADHTEIFAWTVRTEATHLASGARTRFTSKLAAPPGGGVDVAVSLPASGE